MPRRVRSSKESSTPRPCYPCVAQEGEECQWGTNKGCCISCNRESQAYQKGDRFLSVLTPAIEHYLAQFSSNERQLEQAREGAYKCRPTINIESNESPSQSYTYNFGGNQRSKEATMDGMVLGHYGPCLERPTDAALVHAYLAFVAFAMPQASQWTQDMACLVRHLLYRLASLLDAAVLKLIGYRESSQDLDEDNRSDGVILLKGLGLILNSRQPRLAILGNENLKAHMRDRFTHARGALRYALAPCCQKSTKWVGNIGEANIRSFLTKNTPGKLLVVSLTFVTCSHALFQSPLTAYGSNSSYAMSMTQNTIVSSVFDTPQQVYQDASQRLYQPAPDVPQYHHRQPQYSDSPDLTLLGLGAQHPSVPAQKPQELPNEPEFYPGVPQCTVAPIPYTGSTTMEVQWSAFPMLESIPEHGTHIDCLNLRSASTYNIPASVPEATFWTPNQNLPANNYEYAGSNQFFDALCPQSGPEPPMADANPALVDRNHCIPTGPGLMPTSTTMSRIQNLSQASADSYYSACSWQTDDRQHCDT